MRQFLTNSAVNKDIKGKNNFADNHFHYMLRLSEVLPSFPFTTSKMMGDYYL